MKKTSIIASFVAVLSVCLVFLYYNFEEKKLTTVTENVVIVYKSKLQSEPWISVVNQSGTERKIRIQQTDWEELIVGNSYTVNYEAEGKSDPLLVSYYSDGHNGRVD